MEVQVAEKARVFHRLAGVCILDKNGYDIQKRQRAAAEIASRIQRSYGKRPKALDFEPIIHRIPGALPDFGHSLEQSLEQFQDYRYQIAEMTHRVRQHMLRRCGLAYVHLTCGGHVIPCLALNYMLSRAIIRPPLVIGELVKPQPRDEDAYQTYEELVNLLVENDYFGLDGLMITDNGLESQQRPRELLDDFSPLSTIGPLVTARVIDRELPTIAEMFEYLIKRSKLIGIWGWEFDLPTIERKRWFFRRRYEVDKEALETQARRTISALLADPHANVSGLPVSNHGSRSFFVIGGNIEAPSFEAIVQEEERSHHFFPIPYITNKVHITRIAPVTFQDHADSGGTTTRRSFKERLTLHEAVDILAKKLNVGRESLLQPWRKGLS